MAIFVEVVAASALKLAKGFTRLRPSVVLVCRYLLALYLLALTPDTIQVSVVYAASGPAQAWR